MSRGRAVLRATVAAILVATASGAAVPAAASAATLPVDVQVPPASSEGGGSGAIANAQLRWGLNREAGAGAFAGGCNFLSAGRAGNSGSARAWTESDGLYAASAGEVHIERAAGSGWEHASFATRCLDAAGRPVSVASLDSATYNQVVIDGGRGERTSSGLRIEWSGSFTVAFYGGMTYWSASDPVLTLDAGGTGRLTATASGYGTSMEDMTRWEPIPARTIVLAEVRGADLGSAGGFSVLPDYLGVSAQDSAQAARTAENSGYWGSFPADFIAFQQATGQAAYWFTSGGQRDRAKPATALTVNYDADAPAVVPSPGAAAPGADTPQNAVRLRPDGAGTGSTQAGAASGTAATPLSGAREAAGLVPSLLATGGGRLPLVFGGTALALLVSALCALQLSGRLVFPWTRPRG